MSRYFSISRKSSHSNRTANLVGAVTLVAILSGILLFFTNEKQKSQILNSYCGDFGFYGKSLVLMKDSTFRFSYHGCGQTNGYLAGNWRIKDQVLSLSPEHPGENLANQYEFSRYELLPINNPKEDKFTLCEYYQDFWSEQAADEY